MSSAFDHRIKSDGSTDFSMPPPVSYHSHPSPKLGNSILRTENRDRSASTGSQASYHSSSPWMSSSPNHRSYPLPILPPLSPVPLGEEDFRITPVVTDTMLSYPVSPSNSLALKHAMDSALSAERMRIRSLEEAEVNMSLEELRHSLKKERLHSLHLSGELAAIKSTLVTCQAECEINEEARINTLMRRLQTQMECMQREKGRIIVELEREEEMLTNNLQKKLDEVKKEKEILQRKIELAKLNNTLNEACTWNNLEDESMKKQESERKFMN